jgi:hypothetical protein
MELEERLFVGPTYVYRGPYPRSEGEGRKAKSERVAELPTRVTPGGYRERLPEQPQGEAG